MYCAPFCSLPLSWTLRLLSCEAVLEPQQRCRSRNRHWKSPERAWYLRNDQMLKMLAILLRKPVEQVGPFMYGLTMKKFGDIMNPKCSGWNYFRVPLSRPDTCALYDGIFDREGNIRNPMHKLIIRILLVIMDHFLKLPCQGNIKKPRPQIDDVFTGRGEACFDLFNSSRSRRGGRGGRGGRGDSFGDFGDGFGDALNEFYDETGLGTGFGEFNFDENDNDFDFDDDEFGNDGKKKNRMGDDDMYGMGREGELGGQGKGNGRESFRESLKDLSDHYNKIVGKTKRKAGVAEEKEEEFEYLQPKKLKSKPAPKKKKYKGSENRRYMGKLIPVLMHEPFDQSKPWTWVRRHPLQDRVLEGKEIGRSKVHRYKRATLERQMALAKQRYSAHSVYSVGENESVLETAMFGHGQYKKKHPGMAKPYDYKKLREVVPVEAEPEHIKEKKTK